MRNVFIALVVILLAVGGWYLWQNSAATNNQILIQTVAYACDEGKTITATYYEGPEAPEREPGESPTPTGSVEVSLDGGATMPLAQTISASGVRYANADESFIFWNKGNEALVMHNNEMDLAYTNCVAQE